MRQVVRPVGKVPTEVETYIMMRSRSNTCQDQTGCRVQEK